MFVTTQPGRIVGAKSHTIAAGETTEIGCEGLSCRAVFADGGIIVTGADTADRTSGYITTAGEILDFSGIAVLYNAASAQSVVSELIFDTV